LTPGPAPLTPREEQFCIAYGDPESSTYGRSEKSAAAAGYIQPRSAAWKLRRRPKIQARLAVFQSAATAAVGRVLSDLEHTRLLALEKGDLATAARCSELQGKHLSMFADVTIVAPDETLRYDRRAAEDTRVIAFLLRRQDRPPAIESPYPVGDPAAGTSATLQDAPGSTSTPALDRSIEAPARTIAAQIAALELARNQAPQERQESE